MNTQNDLTGKLALDVQGMGALRQSAKAGSPEALKSAATQFEAMFVNMMMKSMRDATPQDGMLDSQQTKMFTTMLDQQSSQSIAKKGIGLADVLIRQLSQQTTNAQALALGGDGAATDPSATAAPAATSRFDPALLQRAIAAAGGASGTSATDGAAGTASTADAAKGGPAHVRSFQAKLGAHAEEASRATGIPAKFMLGQAALESGWGKREIKGRDGSNSHNLFGIKAGPDWKGKVAEAVTTEYVNGKAQTRVERFRAYDSYADSFKDYAKLLASNPRYEKVLASAGDASSFAQGLQRAGYATDPHYARKLTNIIKHSLVG
ncbi:flagellar assembly peptidoglycan hydrolase FlgJ [Duganella sp. LX20W]|uniref:Peptidoglycan hydrolase FlgJ n=1 Tax=Rugamonas brunnea TaxID=2758569 RepID=A0A7W2ICD8_9BURK|nr:flagellar assembly peptidoglycan hydrolase FlgJ [Rugamonas brunnea]MBA5638249.1 flagellar assembly peptidoglycan hydrolase FlgJ [Rugamonas brunnea]